MDRKTINNIVWWIPFKNLRNNVRNFLINKDRDKKYSNVHQKLNYIIEELYDIKNYLNLNDDNRKKIFSEIYKDNYWGDDESRSGSGSTLNATKLLRDDILKIINKYRIKTFLDAPCGDMNWMKEIVHKFESYIGVDIVEDMIEKNKKE